MSVLNTTTSSVSGLAARCANEHSALLPPTGSVTRSRLFINESPSFERVLRTDQSCTVIIIISNSYRWGGQWRAAKHSLIRVQITDMNTLVHVLAKYVDVLCCFWHLLTGIVRFTHIGWNYWIFYFWIAYWTSKKSDQLGLFKLIEKLNIVQLYTFIIIVYIYINYIFRL